MWVNLERFLEHWFIVYIDYMLLFLYYFITFIDLKSDEQEKLRQWLMAETFQRRNSGQKAS